MHQQHEVDKTMQSIKMALHDFKKANGALCNKTA